MDAVLGELRCADRKICLVTAHRPRMSQGIGDLHAVTGAGRNHRFGFAHVNSGVLSIPEQMPKSLKKVANGGSLPTKLQRLRQEYIDLEKTLARLQREVDRSVARRQAKSVAEKRNTRVTRTARLENVGTQTPAPSPAVVALPAVSVEAQTTPAQPAPTPTGSDLNDPKSFGLLPPVSDLEQGASSAEEFQQRLARHLPFTMRVLQTSGVNAVVWREWRAFEKAIRQRLSAMTAPREHIA
jgi:hypothetical protein